MIASEVSSASTKRECSPYTWSGLLIELPFLLSEGKGRGFSTDDHKLNAFRLVIQALAPATMSNRTLSTGAAN